MSGITLYAKDFKSKLLVIELVFLKVIYSKDNALWNALKARFNNNGLKNLLVGFEDAGHIKLLINKEDINSDITLDSMVLRPAVLDLFKEEESKAVEILEYLNKKLIGEDSKRKGFSTKSQMNKSFINGRLFEGYSIEDLKQVIDFKVKEWRNTQWEDYLRPQTLFNTKNFDGYLMAAQRKGDRPVITNEML